MESGDGKISSWRGIVEKKGENERERLLYPPHKVDAIRKNRRGEKMEGF